MSARSSIFVFLIISMSGRVFLPIAHAQLDTIKDYQCDQLGVNCTNIDDPEPTAWVETVLNILGDVLTFMALLAVIMVIVGGVLYITSAGDEKRVEKAKQTLIYAVLGLVIIGLSAIMVNFIISIFFA